MQLYNLENNNKNIRSRKGRGISHGQGKTSGRGQKGQKARNTVRPGFEGGQTPIYRRIPKFGFHNIFRKEYILLNFDNIKKYYKSNEVICYETLRKKNVIHSGKIKNIKLLNVSEDNKIKIDVSKISYKKNKIIKS